MAVVRLDHMIYFWNVNHNQLLEQWVQKTHR